MEQKNGNSFTGFILLGFSDRHQLEQILFVVLLISYIFTLLGNTAIIALSYLDPRLHTPMYFFLSNLSFLDMCYTTSIVPQFLVNLSGADKSISFGGYVAQFFIYLGLGCTECFLLVFLSFNRCEAFCRPLHYTVIMHPRLYHFLCEISPFLTLGSVDTTMNVYVTFFGSVIILALFMFSYGQIVRAVLRIKSTIGQRKGFGTCGSHLMVVSLLFGTAIYVYLHPRSSDSQDQKKFMSLFYTVINP
ncbi:hypothetical protein M91_12982, partial [Bos mutus]